MYFVTVLAGSCFGGNVSRCHFNAASRCLFADYSDTVMVRGVYMGIPPSPEHALDQIVNLPT